MYVKKTMFKEFLDLNATQQLEAVEIYKDALKNSSIIKVFSVIMILLGITVIISSISMIWADSYKLAFAISVTSLLMWIMARFIAGVTLMIIRREIALMIKLEDSK